MNPFVGLGAPKQARVGVRCGTDLTCLLTNLRHHCIKVQQRRSRAIADHVLQLDTLPAFQRVEEVGIEGLILKGDNRLGWTGVGQ